MRNRHSGSAESVLSEAGAFLSSRLASRMLVTLLLFGPIAILASLYLLWLDNKPLSVRVLGYIAFLVIVMAVAAAVSGFADLYTRWVTSRYHRRFKGFPPLIVTLLTFKPGTVLDARWLLRHGRALFAEAFRREGVALADRDRLLVSLGGADTCGAFVSKRDFYSLVDEYIATDPGAMEWATGEFGILRDPTFLSYLESRTESHAKIMGYIEGFPDNLNVALQRLSASDSEEQRPSRHALEPDEHAQIRQLVEGGKLSLWASPRRFHAPHCAIIGDAIYLQQVHTHVPGPSEAPVATIMVKEPSDALRKFVKLCLEEESKESRELKAS